MKNECETSFLRAAVVLPESPAEVESLYVIKKRGRQYRVNSIPFFTYNISLDDIVECQPDEDGLGLFVERVIRKSGNQTYRIRFPGPEGISHPEAVRLRAFLEENKLAYEVFKPVRFCINVPPSFDCALLIDRLNQAKASVEDCNWELADPDPELNFDGSLSGGAAQ